MLFGDSFVSMASGGPGEKYAHDVVKIPPPTTYHHQFRTLIAEVVREEYGREVVLAGVEEEALEYHSTRAPRPAAEECPRPRLLEQCLRRVHDAAVRLLGHVALLARLDRIHRV